VFFIAGADNKKKSRKEKSEHYLSSD
jgi:hypothetical protein